jgi:DNA-binding LytR/AlgR family response regulator
MNRPTTLRVLIVDDESPARRRLRRLLERCDAPTLEFAEARNGLEARDALTATRYDLVFLDIHMPGLSGLELARELAGPRLVFVSAQEQHALEAFALGAADYLLKPITEARVQACLDRVARPLAQAGPSAEQLNALLTQLTPQVASAPPTRISARDGDTTRVFSLGEISHFQSADKYTAFVVDGREYLLDESLSQLEERLGTAGFARVHRSALVNLDWVSALHHDGGTVEVQLRGGERLAVSRRLLAGLKSRLG